MSAAREAEPIVSSDPRSFAWSVLHERHPALISQVKDATPYGRRQREALEELLREATRGVVAGISADAHDFASWQRWTSGYLGRRLDEAPFLWAESYFYRRLLEAVDFYAPGPWWGVDPFRPMKDAELPDPGFAAGFAWFEDLAEASLAERDRVLLDASLWGNRADLGFQLSTRLAGTDDAKADDEVPRLLADDSAVIWAGLESSEAAQVIVVTDNTGRELIPDLLLVDHLIGTGRASEVTLHVKPAPYYISDATTADAAACLRWLVAAPGRLGEAGRRLWTTATAGQLVIATHPFYCSPLPYRQMPQDLAARFAAATLTIMKGDLNYRRLVGDRHWPPTTPYQELTTYFPAPVLALRTLKSDVAVGIDADTVALLDQTGRPWRTTGTHAVIHA